MTKLCLGTLATARGTSLLGWNRSAKRAAVYAKKHWAPRRMTVSTCIRTAAGDGNRKANAIIRRNRYKQKYFKIFKHFLIAESVRPNQMQKELRFLRSGGGPLNLSASTNCFNPCYLYKALPFLPNISRKISLKCTKLISTHLTVNKANSQYQRCYRRPSKVSERR